MPGFDAKDRAGLSIWQSRNKPFDRVNTPHFGFRLVLTDNDIY